MSRVLHELSLKLRLPGSWRVTPRHPHRSPSCLQPGPSCGLGPAGRACSTSLWGSSLAVLCAARESCKLLGASSFIQLRGVSPYLCCGESLLFDWQKPDQGRYICTALCFIFLERAKTESLN